MSENGRERRRTEENGGERRRTEENGGEQTRTDNRRFTTEAQRAQRKE
jgi:hypothetical protein